MLFQLKILKKFKEYARRIKLKVEIIEKAINFAKEKHKGQLGDEGEDYFFHLEQTAEILQSVTDNEEIIASAYLHDTLEDTNTVYDELLEEFGRRVADLVYEVTHEGQKDEKGFYFPRLKSKEAIMIKFADRLSNISRMNNWDENRKEHYLKKSKFWRDNSK